MAKAFLGTSLLVGVTLWGQASGKSTPPKPPTTLTPKSPDFATWFNKDGKAANPGPPEAQVLPGAPSPERPSKTRTEEDDYRDWALGFQQSLAKGDRNAFTNALDLTSLGQKVLPKGRSAALLNPMLEGIRTGATKLGMELTSQVANGGEYKLVLLRRHGNQWKALFRSTNKEGGFNYHDFFLSRGRDGKIVATDLYIALSGEAFSDTLGRILRFVLLEIEHPTKETRALMEAFARFSRLSQMGKMKEALQVLDEIPDRYRREKWILTAQLTHSKDLGEEAYARLVEKAQKLYPGDPSFDMLSFNYWVSHKKYDSALKAIRRMKAFVAEDAFRDACEANLLLAMGDVPGASDLVQKAIAKEPELKTAYWTKLEIDLGKLDFTSVANTLLFLEKKLGQRLPILETVESFSLFVKSEQYAPWQKARSSGELSIPAVAP